MGCKYLEHGLFSCLGKEAFEFTEGRFWGAFLISTAWPGGGRGGFEDSGNSALLIAKQRNVRFLPRCVWEPSAVCHSGEAAASKMASSSSFQVLHCGGRLDPENNHRRRPVATPRRADPGYAHAAPSITAGLASGGLRMARPAQACRQSHWAWTSGKTCWKGRQERVLHPLPTSSFLELPNLAQPIGSEMWRVAASLGVYAALFCLVTDALEMRFMTSSLPPTNRERSRGGVPPLRLCFFTRVSSARRSGEIASTVARM